MQHGARPPRRQGAGSARRVPRPPTSGKTLGVLGYGRLGGAGVDVIDGEWSTDLVNHPVIRYARTHDNLVISPHVGGVTFESQEVAFAHSIRKLRDWTVKLG